MLNWFKDLKVRAKLLIGFGFIAIIAGIIGYSGVSGVQSVKDNNDNLYTVRLKMADNLDKIMNGLLLLRGDLRASLQDTLVSELAAYEKSISSSIDTIDRVSEAAKSLALSGEEKNILDKFSKDWDRLKPVINQLRSMRVNTPVKDILAYTNTTFRKVNREVRKDVTDLIALNWANADKLNNETIESASSTKNKITIYLIFGILLSLSLGFLLAAIIGKPLKELENATENFASGNYDVSVKIYSKDEIGKLTAAFSKMVTQIKETILHLNEKEDIAKRSMEEAHKAKSSSEQQAAYLAEKSQTMLVEMERFSAGDLTVYLENEQNDEIAALFKGFSQATANIRKLIIEVGQAVEAVASAAAQISSSAEQMAAGAQ